MSCRTTHAGSALTTYARLNAGPSLSEAATLSLFHKYRREWQKVPDRMRLNNSFRVSSETYQLILSRVRDGMSNERFSEARKASLLLRLQQAEDQIPDEATIYALGKITGGARSTAAHELDLINLYAKDLDISVSEAKTRFMELENEVDRTRGAVKPETYTRANRTAAELAGLVDEAGTVHAFVTMKKEMEASLQRRLVEVPTRIVRKVFDQPIPLGDSRKQGYIVEAGHDYRNERLEVVILSADGVKTEHAYCQVPSPMWGAFCTDPAEIWTGQIRGAHWYQYESKEDSLRASISPRCPICGQFANIQHSCPVSVMPGRFTRLIVNYDTRTMQRVSDEYVNGQGDTIAITAQVKLPLVSRVQNILSKNGGTVLADLSESVLVYEPLTGRRSENIVEGDLGIVYEDGKLKYNSELLTCNCMEFRENGDCRHVRSYVLAVQRRLDPPVGTQPLTPAQRAAKLAEAQRKFEAATSRDWSRKEAEMAEARRTWRTDAEVSYSEDYAAFKRDYASAQAQVAGKNGTASIVPYIKENALGGMATRESGQAFGMEIEYEFPSNWSYSRRLEANERIGLALREANLTPTEVQQAYHQAARNGYTDKHVNDEGKGTWSWEEDGSVTGGELVTPGMYDEPETWEKLEKAVNIIKENGGIATLGAGAHVHVGTGFYGGDPKKYGELARLMTQHEDVMFRLAQNPERGNHRQGHYTAPLAEAPLAGWANVTDLSRWQNGRTRVLNFQGVDLWGENQNDHPEFRIFDSTLDVGVMQTQIKMSVAMTHAAARNASDEVGGTVRKKEPVGSHFTLAKLRGRRKPTEDEVKEDTGTFRSFVDTLFSRAEDKKQMTALFASTKWCKPDKDNSIALGV